MGELWFRSEYLCEFADTVDSVFTHEQVMGAFSDDVLPLFGASDPLSETKNDVTAGALPPLFG
jgi:hypothetical protein